MTAPGHTACPRCGRHIMPASDATGRPIQLDPTIPVYVLDRDGDGGAVWVRWIDRSVAAEHPINCSKQ